MQAKDLYREVGTFLTMARCASLATVDERGRPHACNVWYAVDDRYRLYFVSSLESEHGRNIIRDAHAALTVAGHSSEPRRIHGLQLHGLCTPVPPPPEGDGKEWGRAWKLYCEKYRFVAGDPLFEKAVWSQCFFRFTPTWVRWVDNRKGFGFKIEATVNGVGKAVKKRRKTTTAKARSRKRARK